MRRSALRDLAIVAFVATALAGAVTRAAGAQDSTSTAQKAPKRRVDRNLITRDDMLASNFSTVYDAVASLRSMWMRPRGSSGQSERGVVWVYVDNARVGDTESLRNFQPRLVNSVRYYDGPSATSRWGVDHAAGVIFVSTFKEGAPTDQPDSARRKP